MTLVRLCCFCFLLSICSALQAQKTTNLLLNGNFVEGTKDWEVFLADPKSPIKAQVIEKSSSYKAYGLADNYVGTNFVELDAKSALQQKVKTKINEPHVLIFAYAHRPNAGDKQLIVEINGKAAWTKTIKNSQETGNFTYKIIQFNPTTELTSVSFYSVSLSGSADMGVLLTDILLNEEPAIDLDVFKNTRH